MTEKPTTRYELGSVDRALEVLTILQRHPRSRLGEMAEKLDANSSTVLRALRVLERHGLVRRANGDMEYVLGTRLVELGQAALASIDIVPSIRPLVAPIVHDFHATAHIGMLRTGMITIIDKVDPVAPTVGYSAVGTRMPLYATAGGKAATALAGSALLDGIGELSPYTTKTITEFDVLRADLEATTARRYSIEREEYHLGFGCVGSAVAVGGDIYTVSISGSLLDPAVVDDCGARLRDAVDLFLAEHAGAVSGL
ncbi:helix-turn-helix domain-containing protein [Microbacterium aerolatum]|uniref:IclR family transcriptional regulator n=1 Tax=Microbacterium aerolatum TaxID=153731 RepID=UPI00384A73F4